MVVALQMDGDDLNWRVETACREAWPAAVDVAVDGWLLRRSGGRIRRTNSVNPLRGKRGNPDSIIDRAEAFYAEHGQSPLFRVPTIAGEVDDVLDARGYSTEAETITIFADLDRARAGADAEVSLTPDPDDEWLQARLRMDADRTRDALIFRGMVASIPGQKRFAATRADGKIVSIGYGAVHDGLLVLESVETDPDFRRRGLAQKTLGSLLAWARGLGTPAACLQVVAENAPARALYASLGFRQELCRYHYRRKAADQGDLA
jgi:ribosomal protein S18 acetylase RimI-like enzyme